MQCQQNHTIICVLEINAFHSLHAVCILDMSHFHRFALWHCWGIVFFSIIPVFVNSLLPPSNKNTYFSLVKISLHLQPLAYYQQCPIIHTVFHRIKQVKIWCSNFRALKWVWHHHPFCDGLSVAHTSDSFLIGQRWAFRLLNISLYWSEFTVVSGQEFWKNNTLLNPEDCSHDCSCWWHTLEFLLPFLCHVAHHSLNSCLDSGSEWQTEVSYPITVRDRKPSSSVSCQCKRAVVIAFLASLCASVSVCHNP